MTDIDELFLGCEVGRKKCAVSSDEDDEEDVSLLLDHED